MAATVGLCCLVEFGMGKDDEPALTRSTFVHYTTIGRIASHVLQRRGMRGVTVCIVARKTMREACFQAITRTQRGNSYGRAGSTHAH